MITKGVDLSVEGALRERIKELACLLSLAQIAGRPGVSLEKTLGEIIALIVPAWQYPEITSARIVFDGHAYAAADFSESPFSQRADIVLNGLRRGFVEVVYLEETPGMHEGPFLREERSLINGIAQQVALVIERKQAEESQAQLENQLRHADRLATMGLLAAGVAHELNEPLGNILGFAQLGKKCPGLPESAGHDFERIESASLRARDVIKNLLSFARQVPPEKTMVDINNVIRDGLFFIDARCAKCGIKIDYALAPELPLVPADAAQINQVLVNLVVNAVQAMPDGGNLKLETRAESDFVCVRVEDSGSGMSPEVIEQAFMPFFTTKDIGEGTGLGLPVVHGIVTSHDGTIQIRSELGHGTQVEFRLPLAGTYHADGV